MEMTIRRKLCGKRYSSYMFTERFPPQHLQFIRRGSKGGGHLRADSDNNAETDDEAAE